MRRDCVFSKKSRLLKELRLSEGSHLTRIRFCIGGYTESWPRPFNPPFSCVPSTHDDESRRAPVLSFPGPCSRLPFAFSFLSFFLPVLFALLSTKHACITMRIPPVAFPLCHFHFPLSGCILPRFSRCSLKIFSKIIYDLAIYMTYGGVTRREWPDGTNRTNTTSQKKKKQKKKPMP